MNGVQISSFLSGVTLELQRGDNSGFTPAGDTGSGTPFGSLLDKPFGNDRQSRFFTVAGRSKSDLIGTTTTSIAPRRR